MDFTKATKDDKSEVKSIWEYCFSDTKEYTDYYFKNRYKKDYNYVIKDNDIIVSSLMANKYKLNINNIAIDVSYIVGVSTPVEKRGKGYASQLIKQTINDLYRKSEQICMLMPIDTSIYTRYGFANIADILRITLPLERIVVKKLDSIDIVKYSNENEIEDMIYIYSQYAKKLDVYFKRDKEYFKDYIDEVYLEDGYIYLCYEAGEPIGYMAFHPKYELGKVGFVREIVALNKNGYGKLLEIIKSHYTQIEDVILDTDVNSYLPFYLDNDNKVEYKHKPFMMSRIINVETVLKKRYEEVIKSNEISNIIIKVSDNIVKENNNIFEISSLGVNIVKKEYDVDMDIYDLTQLLFGYSDVDKFILKHDITLDNDKIDILNKMFNKKNSYFNDYV